jgi:hypothetical protein
LQECFVAELRGAVERDRNVICAKVEPQRLGQPLQVPEASLLRVALIDALAGAAGDRPVVRVVGAALSLPVADGGEERVPACTS